MMDGLNRTFRAEWMEWDGTILSQSLLFCFGIERFTFSDWREAAYFMCDKCIVYIHTDRKGQS